MSDDIIIKHCSPTLAGIKSGNIFTCEYTSKEEILSDIRRLNRLLVPKGLRVVPLRYSESRVLLYIYRPENLLSELRDAEAVHILREAGYENISPDRCVIRLIKRLQTCDDFPHEIGLFLSYPPGDVRGFIENKGKNAKLIGNWKVYGDVAGAKEKFHAFKKCTEIYERKIASGASIEELAVSLSR